MSEVTMPEPVAHVAGDYAIFWAGMGPIAPIIERTGVTVGSRLITTDQAEAYKDACVREALEEAAQSCTNTSLMNVDSYCGATAHMCADRIRALIQPTKESKNG